MGKIESYFKAFKIKNEVDISKAELKKRFRILQMKYHPDRGGSTSQSQFINEAYKYLLDLIIKNEKKQIEIFKNKCKVWNEKFYFYADGSVIDRRKKRVVRYKGRNINVNI